jgi:hypothetical protein
MKMRAIPFVSILNQIQMWLMKVIHEMWYRQKCLIQVIEEFKFSERKRLRAMNNRLSAQCHCTQKHDGCEMSQRCLSALRLLVEARRSSGMWASWPITRKVRKGIEEMTTTNAQDPSLERSRHWGKVRRIGHIAVSQFWYSPELRQESLKSASRWFGQVTRHISGGHLSWRWTCRSLYILAVSYFMVGFVSIRYSWFFAMTLPNI